MADKSAMIDKINDMRSFLDACIWCGHLLPEQVCLLKMALDALEREINNEQNGGE